MSNLKDRVFAGVMEWNDGGNEYDFVEASRAYDEAKTLEEKDEAKRIMDECFAVMYKNFSDFNLAVYNLQERLSDMVNGEYETVTILDLN